MQACLLVDFGSTYTKLTAVDLDKEEIICVTKSPSTVSEDIMLGLNKALMEMYKFIGTDFQFQHKLACSSAAGGLRMVVIGLVPELTVEAARQAAFGAGAKIVGCYSYEINRTELKQIESLDPDIILLAGGTDGGNKEVIIQNARILASSNTLQVPFIFAGNKAAADSVGKILSDSGKDVRITENVMPEFGVINPTKVRETIRKIFIEQIVEAKGLKRAEQFVQGILMPTPSAVLKAAQLLADGTPSVEGIGELMLIDLGGATTDVHSVANGIPTQKGVIQKGLTEPRVKRTVEGDLGMRYNSRSIMEAVGKEELGKLCGFADSQLDMAIKRLETNVAVVPQMQKDVSLDLALAQSAVAIACKRHVGTISTHYSPFGEVFVQHGKDLTEVKSVVGTGGAIINSSCPEKILEHSRFRQEDPFCLLPKQPDFYIDSKYSLYAIGLLAEVASDTALRIAKKYLLRLDGSHS